VLLLNPDVRSLNNRSHVQECSEQVHQVLLEYCVNCYPTVPDKYNQLLSLLPELKEMAQRGEDFLYFKHMQGNAPHATLLMEMLHAKKKIVNGWWKTNSLISKNEEKLTPLFITEWMSSNKCFEFRRHLFTNVSRGERLVVSVCAINMYCSFTYEVIYNSHTRVHFTYAMLLLSLSFFATS